MPKPAAKGAMPSLAIPLPASGLGSESYWRDELQDAAKRMKKELPTMRENLDRYRGERGTVRNMAKRDVVAVNVDFYNTEQKKAQLFYQTPDMQVLPKRPQFAAAAPMVQAIVNDTLGPHALDARRMMDEVVFDVLCPAGFGPTKIGYDRVTQMKTVPTGRMEPAPIDPLSGQPPMDPTTGQPAQRLALNPLTGEPETTTVPQTIWDRYYWQRISPPDLRVPVGFSSTNFDEAPWLGFKFRASADVLARTYGIQAQNIGETTLTDTLASERDKEFFRSTAAGYEVWYRASLYDDTEKNPERIRRLVLLEGKGRDAASVLVHQNSPYQQFDADGAFQIGMKGFPIHVLTIRTLSDACFPPSDCTISRAGVDELSRGRSQMIKQRDRNVPLRAFNATSPVWSKETIQQIERGDIQALIKAMGPIQEQDFKELAVAAFPQENFEFNTVVMQDILNLWGFLGNATTTTPSSNNKSTATIAQIQQQATDTRMAFERERVMSWFTKGVEKVAALLQLFQDTPAVVRMVGDDGAQRLATWDKTTIQGEYAFSIKPDSSIRVDAAEEREQFLRVFNLVANHPGVNPQELLTQVAERFNIDPARMILPPQPPQPQRPTEPPRINISITPATDLNPNMPQYPNVIHLLTLAGVDPSAMAQPMAPPAAPPSQPAKQIAGPRIQPRVSPAQHVAPVSQHDTQLTGRPVGPRVPVTPNGPQ